MCLHIPLDWWPRRKGAGHVPPPAFEQTMVQSRCGILLCIWRPNWVDASGQRTNIHHSGERKARKALWALLASEAGVLAAAPHLPPARSRWTWGWLLSMVPMGREEGGDPAAVGWPHTVPEGLGRGSEAAAGGRAAAPGREGLQTSLLPQPSGNSSALRWKRSWSKWGRGQYENGYNGIKIVAPASPPAGARL